jgi:acetyl-CoA C-acetyltransferase
MSNAVIVGTARTPIARARKGSLVDVDAFRLAEVAVGAAVERSGVPAADIDDLIVAESLQGGGVIARYTAIQLGLTHVPGLADNRHCAAGLSAVQIGAGSIMAGMDQVVVAGGTESLTTMPGGTKWSAAAGEMVPWMSPSHPETPDAPAFDMSITVGHNAAVEAGLTRHDVDAWAVHTHQQAVASIDNGWFDEQIVAVPVPQADGSEVLFSIDEHPRRNVTIESLGELAPLHPEIEGFTVTAGNAAGLNDAAAAVVLTSDAYAGAHGLAPLAQVRSWASVGLEPARTGMGPTLAIPRPSNGPGYDRRHRPVRDQRGLLLGHRRRHPGPRPTRRVNVNGSGCSLGHPSPPPARACGHHGPELRRQRCSSAACPCAPATQGSALVEAR